MPLDNLNPGTARRPRALDRRLVETIDATDVDVVVTLCAEEVCPVFMMGKAMQVHWRLPDPAADAGTEEKRLQAFRNVRDELRRRLACVFGAETSVLNAQ